MKLISIVLLIVSALSGLTACADAIEIPFDAARWKADARDGGSRARARMVSSLRKDFLKEGMSYSEVEALLGEPDERTDDEDYKMGSRFYSYGLGYHLSYAGNIGFGIHHHILLISFEPSGKFLSSFIIVRER